MHSPKKIYNIHTLSPQSREKKCIPKNSREYLAVSLWYFGHFIVGHRIFNGFAVLLITDVPRIFWYKFLHAFNLLNVNIRANGVFESELANIVLGKRKRLGLHS